MVMTVTTLVGIVKKWAICWRMGDGNTNLQGLLHLVCLIMNSRRQLKCMYCSGIVVMCQILFFTYAVEVSTFIKAN